MKSTLCATVGYLGAALILGSCGGGGGGSSTSGGSSGGGGDTIDPTVSFLVSDLSIGSEGTATVAVTATDNIGVTSGPTVTCTNGGSYANGVFTPPVPAVTTQTVSVCTATASDAAGNSDSGTLTVTINPTAAITLTGTVGKGLVSGATIAVRDAADGFGAEPIATTTTAADGTYSVTLPAGTEASELLVVEAALAGAQMVCDAANCFSELSLDFGDAFTIPQNDTAPTGAEIRRILSTPLPTPDIGTTEANINVFTHYNLMSMVLPARADLATPTDTPSFQLEDYAAARQSTAVLFSLPDADFFAISFIDVTQPITSTNQNDIYAALISGGVLGAANEADDPFSAILDLQADAIGSGLIGNEGFNDINLISLEDIFENASALATQLNITTNAFTLAQNALTDRLNVISASPADKFMLADGSFTPPPAEINFTLDSISVNAGDANFLSTGIDNPDGLFAQHGSEGVPFGETSFSADVTSVTPDASISLDRSGSSSTQLEFSFGGDLTAGTYETEVTFTVSEYNQTYTDTITIEVTPTDIGIVQDSVSMTTASDSTFRLDFDNPNNIDISTVRTHSPNGPGYFEVLSIDATGADVGYGPAFSSAPVGTYNIEVILGQGLGAEANNVVVPLEITVSAQ